MRFTLFIISAVLLCCSFSAMAKTYRWLDDNNQMHFGDKIPPKYLIKEHDEMNEQGVVTRHRAAAKTAEEKAEERRIKREQKQVELIEKRKRQRDRVLLDTYTTERDLIVARDSRLEAVDAQIQLAGTIVKESSNKVDAMNLRVIAIQESNREVPLDLYELIKIEKEQVITQKKILESHKLRRGEISAQFNGYIERFHQLKDEERARKEKYAREWGQEF